MNKYKKKDKIDYDKIEKILEEQNANVKNNGCKCDTGFVSLPKELISNVKFF